MIGIKDCSPHKKINRGEPILRLRDNKRKPFTSYVKEQRHHKDVIGRVAH